MPKRLRFLIDYNVPTLGEEADLEAQTFGLAQMPIESTNVQLITAVAIDTNTCYATVLN